MEALTQPVYSISEPAPWTLRRTHTWKGLNPSTYNQGNKTSNLRTYRSPIILYIYTGYAVQTVVSFEEVQYLIT